MAVPAESKPTFLLGVRYGERKHDPPPGLVWRKVQKDETLGTIADEYGVRWMDIALYNWHTIKLLEINWYLNHYLHCTLNNGTTYMFSGKESSGKEKGGWLLVPDMPPSVKKGVARSIAVVRDGNAKHDIKLQVSVVEWVDGVVLPDKSGLLLPVAGKWLYVFSGPEWISATIRRRFLRASTVRHPLSPVRLSRGIFRAYFISRRGRTSWSTRFWSRPKKGPAQTL